LTFDSIAVSGVSWTAPRAMKDVAAYIIQPSVASPWERRRRRTWV
jgi:hypothetical protein